MQNALDWTHFKVCVLRFGTTKCCLQSTILGSSLYSKIFHFFTIFVSPFLSMWTCKTYNMTYNMNITYKSHIQELAYNLYSIVMTLSRVWPTGSSSFEYAVINLGLHMLIREFGRWSCLYLGKSMFVLPIKTTINYCYSPTASTSHLIPGSLFKKCYRIIKG